MEEKVLIKSEQYDVKKVIKIMVIVGFVLSILGSIIAIGDTVSYYNSKYDDWYEDYIEHQEDGDCGPYYDSWETCYRCENVEQGLLGYVLEAYFGSSLWLCLIPVAALALIGWLIYLWLHSYELTVTDKRIYGKIAWGKRVDLPVDSVSATATISLFKGVSVSTSSGRISFRVIKNADEIYKVMNNLLIERQQEKVNATVAAAAPKSDEADQLKKYKDLLDSGVITQEDFEAKKKQLLGL